MDDGHAYTDKELEKLNDEIDRVYIDAKLELDAKLAEFEKKSNAKENALFKNVLTGKMSYEEFDEWKAGNEFQRKQWEQKISQVTDVICNANKAAVQLINNKTPDVFAYNASYMNYSLEHDAGVDFGFGLYSAEAVARLIKDNPQILPEWKINEPKDYAWNEKKVNNAITQGIIQGESSAQISKRISNDLLMQNKNLSKTFAQTALTQAQNAGRLESMREAEEMGIKLNKQWMATLDSHTRDSHAEIDGESVPTDSHFSNGLEYPAQAGGAPAEVYNCRCTMVADLKDYPSKYKRYNNEKGKAIQYMTYKDWEKSKSYGKQGLVASQKVKAKEDEKKAKLKQAKDNLKQLEKQIADKGIENKEFSGIWYNQTVTYADYEAKKDSIQSKIDYYNAEIPKLKAAGTPLKVATAGEMEKKLEDLKEFQLHGEEYSKLLKERDEAQKLVDSLTPKPDVKTAFGSDAYTQARKDAALWAQTTKQADDALRKTTGDVWRNATDTQKDAIYDYTRSYSKFNEPLRGWEYGQSNYSTGSGFLGVGNTDLNAGYQNNGQALNAMTEIISKCTYGKDMWLQRGVGFSGTDRMLGVSEMVLRRDGASDLQKQLLGKVVTEYGFMSCGSSKGGGFTGKPVMFNIYAPSGTKMMYVEPFSAFGNGSGRSWDGTSTQRTFGDEIETILQQGTQFRITKVEVVSGGYNGSDNRLYIDMEVINQLEPQLYKKK